MSHLAEGIAAKRSNHTILSVSIAEGKGHHAFMVVDGKC